jgi:phosphohistidine phosphatase
MKKLYLIRHAKSSWKIDAAHDMDRPLKGRGIRDAYNTSQWLKEQEVRPQLIISSPATRALHTALIFSKNLNYSYSNIQIEAGVYEASTQELFRIVRGLDDQHLSVMIFGHNPTITDFVNKCIDHRIDNVPTTGVACLKFNEAHWAEIDKKAELVFFDYPKRRL